MDAISLSNTASSATSSINNQVSNLNSYMDQLRGIAEYNNAAEAAAAADQRDWSAQQAELTRSFNASEAAKNRDWQKLMSDTAHQREIADLKAAGLNPILSALNGNGATTTSGATASASAPSGSKAEIDKSLTTALVSLLGNNLDAMTKLADMSTSALTNSAIADKYTSAEILASRIGANASMYGANLSSAASRYSAELANEASHNAAYMSYRGSLAQADASKQNAKYSADKSLEGTKYSADKNRGNTWINAGSDLANIVVDKVLNKILGNNSGGSLAQIIPFLLK